MVFYRNIKSIICAVGCFMSTCSLAGTMGETSDLWSVTASLGYTVYEDMYQGDGQTPVGRFAIDRNVLNFDIHKLNVRNFFSSSVAELGAEIAVQNGNTMRINVPQSTLDILGGLPIQTTLKPMFDFLLTLKLPALTQIPVLPLVKGGFAYRRWELDDRISVPDKSQIAGTVQAGLGYQITERAMVNLMYQGVYGGPVNFTVNSSSFTGNISNIPVQNGVLLGVNYIL